MSLAIYKKGLRKGWLVGILPALAVSTLILIVAGIWPEFKDQMDTFTNILSSPLYEGILGEASVDLFLKATFEGFYAAYIFIWMEMILIFVTIFLPARIITSEIDNNTLDVILSYPIPRWQFISQKFAVYNTYTLSFPVFMMGSTIIGAASVNETINIVPVSLAFLGLYLWFFAFGAVSLLCGTIFLESGRAFPASGAIIIGMWIVERLGALVDYLNPIQTISIFHYLDGPAIINNGTFPIIEGIIVLGAGLVMFFASLIIFEKRDLAF
ncbi:MAG: hypothetical protein ACXAC7_10295 [Candidatus Hodarchaeales archaeon]|jgi:ABC-2 type transport system permease protein